jgi:aryl-alcohol dehydrogenase-like predicted oxidoreductase
LRVAIGTAQFGVDYGISNLTGKTQFLEVSKILKFAKNNKIGSIDTAINYGESENILGKVGIHEFQVTTKLPEIPEDIDNITLWMVEQLEASLVRLKKPNIYSVLLHRPNQLLSNRGKEIYDGLQFLKRSGYVEKIGISIYSFDELDSLLNVFNIDQIQVPLNPIDRRLINSNWLYALYNKGIEVHVRSIFLQGLLLMRKEDIPKKFNQWNYTWDKWNKWLMNEHITALEACISYVRAFPEINTFIVGVNSLAQIKEIFSIINSELKSLEFPEELSSIDLNLINPTNWSKLP